MNSTVLRKLRKFESETWERNRARLPPLPDPEPEPRKPPRTNWCYTLYTWLFRCQRLVLNTLFQEDAPRKTLEITMPESKYPWLSVYVLTEDGEEVDVTEDTTELTFESIQSTLGRPIATAHYIDARTFEVVPILPKEVKHEGSVPEPSTDPVPST